MIKHIEITWDDGTKTIEAYSTNGPCTGETKTAADCYRFMQMLAHYSDVQPISYIEID